MKVYKLTDKEGETKHGTQWGENITHKVKGKLIECRNGIHAYSDPLLAVLHNPIHGEFDLSTAQLWECEASEEHINDNGMKSCHRWLTTIKKIPLPEITIVQKVAYGILCVLEVCESKEFVTWANNWLSGKDRSKGGASSVSSYFATSSAPVSYVAWASSSSAREAAYRDSVSVSSYVARTAYASSFTAYSLKSLDLVSIAKKAMEVK